MSDEFHASDPGWWEPLKGILITNHFPWRRGKAGPRPRNAISLLRSLYLSLFLAGWLLLYVLLMIRPIGRPQAALGAGLAVLGAASVSASQWVWRRPLDMGDARFVAASFRTRFFLSFAVAEAPIFVSFAAAMIVDEAWPFVIGLAWFSLGMIAIAPSRRTFRSKDEELAARGSPISLTRAFLTTTAPDRPS